MNEILASSETVNGTETETKVSDMTEARARRARRPSADDKRESEEDKRKKPSIEALYCDHMKWRHDVAIGGRAANGCIDLTLYKWKGTHWAAQEPAEAHRDFLDWVSGVDLRKISVRCATSATETAATRLLGISGHDIGHMAAIRGDDAIIPTTDGYLHIARDGTIRLAPADKMLGMNYCVPASIDRARVCDGVYSPAEVPAQSALGLYLDRFFPDLAVRALLQEACAATLLPRTFEKALVLVGTGANGKSTLLHMLRALHPAHAAYRLEQSQSRFGNQGIAGKTLLIASEAPRHLGDAVEQQLKSIISRDPIEVERKRRDPITVTPCATLVIAANQPLRFTDRTHGAARKYLHIPFSVRLAENDPARVPDFHKRITEDAHEMSALLDWILIGARRLLARGRLMEPPTAVQALAEELRLETDNVFAWAKNNEATQTHERLTAKSALYRHYADTVLDEGGKPCGLSEFWQRLKEIVPVHECQRRTDGGKRDRYVDIVVAGVASIADPFPY